MNARGDRGGPYGESTARCAVRRGEPAPRGAFAPRHLGQRPLRREAWLRLCDCRLELWAAHFALGPGVFFWIGRRLLQRLSYATGMERGVVVRGRLRGRH